MKTSKALTLSLGELNMPVITEYQVGLALYKIYRQKEYKGETVALQKDAAERRDFNKHLLNLIEDGVLNTQSDLPPKVFAFVGHLRWTPEEVVCAADPFSYISHLSAMAYHGLTDRIPVKLYVSSPGPTEWKKFAQERMEKDLGENLDEYTNNGLPLLTRSNFLKVGKTEIHSFKSKHLGAYKNAHERVIRVSTIGRTFLDMLRSPELCGGINHVLEVYDEYAEKYLRLITDEINTHGAPIDKVRAGYIISERLNIKNDVVERWSEYAQRGGSRKLDATGEYIPEWSDRWCLSINVFERSK